MESRHPLARRRPMFTGLSLKGKVAWQSVFVALLLLLVPAEGALRIVVMPGITNEQVQKSTSWCLSKPVVAPSTEFLAALRVNASSAVESLRVYSVERPNPRRRDTLWDCPSSLDSSMASLGKTPQLVFAWSAGDPLMLALPSMGSGTAGFPVGSTTRAQFFILQIVYKRSVAIPGEGDHSGIRLLVSKLRRDHLAGVYHVYVPQSELDSGRPKSTAVVACIYHGSYTLHPMSARAVSGAFGRRVELFRDVRPHVKKQKILEILPQEQLGFIPVPDNNIEIHSGDAVILGCSYEKSSLSSTDRPKQLCSLELLFEITPSANDVKKPPVLNFVCNQTHPGKATHLRPSPSQDSSPVELHAQGKSAVLPEAALGLSGSHLTTSDWPSAKARGHLTADRQTVGAISGVALDPTSGHVVAIHLADRSTERRQFDSSHMYRHIHKGPINVPVVLELDPLNGTILKQWGENQFYLPHSVAVDKAGNVWISDRALHQVFKFPHGGGANRKPLVVLGEQFRAGTDNKHFCKPTDIAFAHKADIVFIADGHCNSRVMKFTSTGKFLDSWSMSTGQGHHPQPVPHSVAISPNDNALCVANSRSPLIVCFDPMSGEVKHTIRSTRLGGQVEAIAFGGKADDGHHLLHAVGGKGSSGVTMDINHNRLLDIWDPRKSKFHAPHSLAASEDGSVVYIGELTPGQLWKLTRRGVSSGLLSKTVNTLGTTAQQQSKLILHATSSNSKLAKSNLPLPTSSSESRALKKSPHQEVVNKSANSTSADGVLITTELVSTIPRFHIHEINVPDNSQNVNVAAKSKEQHLTGAEMIAISIIGGCVGIIVFAVFARIYLAYRKRRNFRRELFPEDADDNRMLLQPGSHGHGNTHDTDSDSDYTDQKAFRYYWKKVAKQVA